MRSPRVDKRQHSAAFTLVELLVVMGIAAVIAAMAAASYVGITRRSSREGAREEIMNVIRQARHSAVDSGRGAVVRIDPAEGTLFGLSSEVVAAWHFEELVGNTVPGAKNLDGTANGNPSIAEGHLGLCLEFDDTDDYVDCGSYPVYDQTQGIRLEVQVNPAAGAGTQGIMSKAAFDDGGNDDYGYAVWLEQDTSNTYSLHASVALDENAANRLLNSGTDTERLLELNSNDMVLPGHRWTHVAMEFDGFEARLYRNGVLVDLDSLVGFDASTGSDEDDENDPNTATDKEYTDNTDGTPVVYPPSRIRVARTQALDIGHYDDGASDYYFQGYIDEPRVISIAGGERVHLPDRVPLVTTEESIYFTAEGTLDLAYHTAGIHVAVGDPYQSAVCDSYDGTANTLTLRASNPFPPDGGYVIAAGGLLSYTGTSGLDLEGVNREYSLGSSDPVSGDDVYFARVVEISHTGLVNKQ